MDKKKSKIKNYNHFKNSGKNSIGLINGKFKLIHQGHLRLIKFASEICSYLVISIEVESDLNEIDYISSDLKLLELLSNVKLITYYKNEDFEKLISKIRPKFLFKGKEFENKISIEQELAKKYKYEILYASSDEKYDYDEITDINRTSHKNFNIETETVKEIYTYNKRHSLNLKDFKNKLKNIKNKKVIVIGDIILDSYTECSPIGMSQEDPTIVVTPNSIKHFVGGAAIIAAHARSLGASSYLYSVCGDDEYKSFISQKLKQYKVNGHVLIDKTRPTTTKLRYKVNGKSLLRVNNYRSHSLSLELNKVFLNRVIRNLKNADLVIFADFSYGLLNDENIARISNICNKLKIPIVADSQSSSQIGNITKFKNTLLVTPTEFEARTSLNDKDSGLSVLCDKLQHKINSKFIVITLGSEGLIALEKNSNGDFVDKLSAFNKNPIDVSGAGDCLLVAMSLGLVSGMNLWESLLFGNISAAFQVSRNGNIPITSNEILDFFV